MNLRAYTSVSTSGTRVNGTHAKRDGNVGRGPHLSKIAPTPALWALFRWTCSPVARRIPSFTAMDRWEKEAMSSSFQPGGRRAQGHAAASGPRGHPSPHGAAIQRQHALSQDHPKVGSGEPLHERATGTRFPSTYVWEMPLSSTVQTGAIKALRSPAQSTQFGSV